MHPRRFTRRRLSHKWQSSPSTQEPPEDAFGTPRRIQQPSDEELVAEYERNMNIFCFTFQICLIIYAFVVIAYVAIQYYLEPISTQNKGEY